MKVQITFKLTAESRDELMKTMGPTYQTFRAHAEEMIKAGAFGPAEKVKARWLLTPGQWDGSPTNVEQGEPMSEATAPVSETVPELDVEIMPPPDYPPPPSPELPIPALDWCSAAVTEFGHIQNLCQQLSNNQWNIVQILPVKGKLVGSEGYGVVAFRAQALRYIDQPPIDQTPSNTPDDRYMGR